ncbi:MAG: fatty acid desaturase family protein [Bacteriovoracaceae bacterium]
MKINELLNRDEIKQLTKLSDLKGFQSLFTTWFLIFFSLFLFDFWPNFITGIFAVVIIGGRHLALAILMHEASHSTLFKTKWLNEFMGKWFCAYPNWQDLLRYRIHHLKHHNFTSLKGDPDLDLVENFPITRKSLMRKFFRDLIGITGIKRVYGSLLIDFGFIEYTVSSSVRKIDQSGRRVSEIVLTGLKNIKGVVIFNSLFFILLNHWGKGYLFLLWVGAYLTTFSFFIRIRSIAEHAGLKVSTSFFENTRTVYANILARVTVAPHYVNYHLEHHLLISIPCFNLKKLHAKLSQKKLLNELNFANGYIEVLKKNSYV